MALEDYDKALKMGQKVYRQQLSKGQYPYLPILDNILKYMDVQREIYIGLVDIPLDQIVGTRTEGRSHAFASNFMPLLDGESEFAYKWQNLSIAHEREGIRDPVKLYEFMNQYYVEEGNKRVSVLKFYEAVSVPANVYRIMPTWSEDKNVRIYYEFVHFFDLTGLTTVYFSHTGGFKALVEETGNSATERWSEEEILMLRSLINRFSLVFDKKKMEQLSITLGDALLKLIQIYDYASLCEDSVDALKKKVEKVWEELEILSEEDTVELKLDPAEKPSGTVGMIKKILVPSVTKYKVAFVNEKTPKTSAWTYSHDLGRAHLQNTYPGLQIAVYNDALREGKPAEVIEQAIEDGGDIIFTTSPRLLDASVKVAVEHPEVIILNCSLNTSFKTVRTYYGRMYEAKFLSGLVAGAMCQNNDIGYVADYPLYGMIANINAFARGVQMTNPKARVKLFWSKLKDQDNLEEELGKLSYVCGQELIMPNSPSRSFGLYSKDGEKSENLIAPVWNWGQYYVRILENIRHGIWKSEEERKALNYWWGLSAGVVSAICSKSMPSGVRKLVGVMQESIKRGDLRVFDGALRAQNGVIISNEDHAQKTPQEIMTMDWLLHNIDGRIPTMKELTDEAKEVTRIQGVVSGDGE